jgi:hypothetical protein
MPKKKEPTKVGQALYDILSKPQHDQEVGETLAEMSPDYIESLKKCIEDHVGVFKSPFYIVVMGKKETYALNIVRHWYVARQTLPTSKFLMGKFPNCFHEVYRYNEGSGDCHLLWCLPEQWCHEEIMTHPESYDRQMVDWVFDHYNKGLGEEACG